MNWLNSPRRRLVFSRREIRGRDDPRLLVIAVAYERNLPRRPTSKSRENNPSSDATLHRRGARMRVVPMQRNSSRQPLDSIDPPMLPPSGPIVSSCCLSLSGRRPFAHVPAVTEIPRNTIPKPEKKKEKVGGPPCPPATSLIGNVIRSPESCADTAGCVCSLKYHLASLGRGFARQSPGDLLSLWWSIRNRGRKVARDSYTSHRWGALRWRISPVSWGPKHYLRTCHFLRGGLPHPSSRDVLA
ncbi:hypothetical protein GGR56DRAFT_163624 [Xylariaceae sp. FL0804]|nr:hypothetical protein GGR56DRAFT_163624 [Xylariaceae sp. FL0804]